MASPREILKKAIKPDTDGDYDKSPPGEEVICELISKAFTTRNLLHFAHWNTKSYATHVAVGSLYDDIISDIDDIVETYQGKYGLIDDLKCSACELPSNITEHVQAEAKWVEQNRSKIACNTTAIENLVDTLIGHYHKTVYKLKNLS
jgi:oligoribonuclease (3'-5' exoribonuclease)